MLKTNRKTKQNSNETPFRYHPCIENTTMLRDAGHLFPRASDIVVTKKNDSAVVLNWSVAAAMLLGRPELIHVHH
jgi:hypothetical protein